MWKFATAVALVVGVAGFGLAPTSAFAQAQKPGPQNCADIKDAKAKQECVQKAAKAKTPNDKKQAAVKKKPVETAKKQEPAKK